MAQRPFATTFDKDSPMTPQSATTNISYQTNVNRQKTKKWAEAKPVNYDDYGDYDEDDPYGYEPPVPVSKPGFRQQGQPAQSSSSITSPVIDNNKKYGDLPPLPGATVGRGRANSFDADDEKRSFSNATIRQPSPSRTTGPPTRFSQITGIPTVRNPSGPPPSLHISTQQAPQPHPPRQIDAVVSPAAESPHPDVLSPGRVNTGEGSTVSPISDLVTPSTSSDYYARRDYSPSAVPPPLATRASPAPQTSIEPVTTTQFPARKSSLSQSNAPPLEDIMRGSAVEQAPRGRDSSPGASSRSPSTPTTKALPFIRPADIYRRRMEEEKERQSLESSRPSMDSIIGSRSSEPSDIQSLHHLKHESSSENLGARRRMSAEDETSDSGRRLMPMLDTVTERKSEYGFEGLNINDYASPAPPQHEPISQDPVITQLDVEEARRQSVSPKLPDLNRISGFGMDMFSQASLPNTTETETKPTTASTVYDISAKDDLSLRNQPSLGFRSVVNQAFDTSVPPTPASRSGSGVRRTDSESTGTAGVSPIMSRVPSNAVPSFKAPDMTTPSIPEAINEPTSPESFTETLHGGPDGQEIPGFKMGHRRDISAPSPGNSPARTPDLNTAPTTIATGHYADVSVASSEPMSASLDDPLDAPRTSDDDQHSFRPNLPGGWTSYATTGPGEVPLASGESTRSTPSLSHAGPEEELNLTPTTTKRTLPETEFGAAVEGAALLASSGAALDKHDGVNWLATPTANEPQQETIYDPGMMPAEDAHSAKEHSKRAPPLLPALAQAPQETQLHPDIASRAISNDYGIAPPPPPKDTPAMTSVESGGGYFPGSTIPSQTSQIHHPEAIDGDHSPEIDDTDAHSYEEENDKLQKEIVKSLTSRSSSAAPLDSNGQARESTYYPQELDDYWDSTAEDALQPPLHSEIVQSSAVPGNLERSMVSDTPTGQEQNAPITAPLSPRKAEDSSLAPPRPTIQSRFSFEEIEDLSADQKATQISDPLSSGVTELRTESAPQLHELDSQSSSNKPSTVVDSHSNETARETTASDHSRVDPTPMSTGHHVGRDAGVLASAAAIGGIAAGNAHKQSGRASQSERRHSLAEEKDHMVSEYPVSPTPPENEHPARSPEPYLPLSTEHFPQHPVLSPFSPIDKSIQQRVEEHESKNVPFKEIIGMASQKRRIEVFNDMRQQWASIDPGLNDWMSRLQGQFPEHANATGPWNGSRTTVPGGSARSKFMKPGPAPPLQQPYYQQYLNASSPTTPSTPSKPDSVPAFQPNAQQGFAASSSKLTGQQVQAKGKELLHTAGIFGGKAGKAGKGLLAKGKNKFRAAGGGDKASPPPKPKNERRSSWGFPLNITRSSHRQDGSSGNFKYSTPTPIQRSRAATTTSWEPLPSTTGLAADESLGIMSRAAFSTNIPSQSTLMTPQTIRQVTEGQHSQIPPSQDDDGVSYLDNSEALASPAPIKQDQPSWNTNAAVTTERNTSHDDLLKKPKILSESEYPTSSLSVPVDVATVSERSNSDDVHFFDAAEQPKEEPSDMGNDWIMVSPTHDSKENSSQEDTILVPRENTKQDLEPMKPIVSPTTSIIDRPRGSSYVMSSPPTSAKSQNIPAANSLTPKFSSVEVLEKTQIPAQISEPHQPHQLTQAVNLQRPQVEPTNNSTSSFLPPIRRTSTFGLGFGSRQAKTHFPVEDGDNKLISNSSQPMLTGQTAPNGPSYDRTTKSPHLNQWDQQQGTEEVHTIPTIENREFQQLVSPPRLPFQNRHQMNVAQVQDSSLPPSSAAVQASQQNSYQSGPPKAPNQRQSRQGPIWTNRPPLSQESSSSNGQKVMPLLPPNSPPRAAEVLQRPELNESHVEWKLNRSNPATTPLAQASPSDLKEMGLTSSQPNISDARSIQAASSDWKEMDLASTSASSDRNSWDPHTETKLSVPTQRQLPYEEPEYDEKPQLLVVPQPKLSESPQSSMQQQDAGYDQRPQPTRAGTMAVSQQKPYEQPPSSAQRYPDLFRPGQTAADSIRGGEPIRGSVDLPSQYYQAPVSRAAAFLPRQQTNEYQLPGVGPPEPIPVRQRRNSGFLHDIGGRLSRASSRERRSTSISREPNFSRGNDDADSLAPSEGAQERQRKRSSFFGALHYGSNSGMATPASRESTIAHNSASRTDLVGTPDSQRSPDFRHQKKKSFFSGSLLTDPKLKSKKLDMASTSTTGTNDSGKKNRFSGFSGLFSKSSQSARAPLQDQPQATKELSHYDRQPIESPMLNATRTNKSVVPIPQKRSPSQSRNVLSKLSLSNTSNLAPREKIKPRRSSASGLLNGFMGRKPNGTDRGSDESRSQGSASNSNEHPPVLLSQTYTDLQQQEQHPYPVVTQGDPPPNLQSPSAERQSDSIRNQTRLGPIQDQYLPDTPRAVSSPERGRPTNRESHRYTEPQYDSVPIPGGYSLVRSQGGRTVPTDYDPRGINNHYQYTQSPECGVYQSAGGPHLQQNPGEQQQYAASRVQQSYPAMVQQNRQPQLQSLQKLTLNNIETYQNFTSRQGRLSREDLLARSPPKSLKGQQRPYQISLPGVEDEEDERRQTADKEPSTTSSNSAMMHSQKDPIQRLQQPTLRHPASPAGYPLPDTVFSPIDARASDIPPPPPPKWPSHLDNQHNHERQPSLTQSMSTMDIDLDRSNTRRTAVSAVSGFSGPPVQSGLSVPGKEGTSFDGGRSESAHSLSRVINAVSPSPSPPSPMRTPPARGLSPETITGPDKIRSTEVHVPSQNHGHEEDLYNASPRLQQILPSSSASNTNANGHAFSSSSSSSCSSSQQNESPKSHFDIGVPDPEKENQKAKGVQMQKPVYPEEKIPYGSQSHLGLPNEEDEEAGPASMSATSYPGQEWNPYAGGWNDDGID